ncbi:hypothetical protein Slin15195_G118640 [Septoria linicola]|uniref:Uncharacterized protein n=1 Tax=Septoria linicola TaxID=215465 RepID=A0A9Q9EPY0_9PEZI|nr:hypothetical protein Slin14017_G095630 [Septoria linicola]USW58545.1 hypothetical protein Slin15195_G118640 [Septoria linicola]
MAMEARTDVVSSHTQIHDCNRPRSTERTLYAYPSTGGFVRKHITRVELDWFGLTLNDLTALVAPGSDDVAEDALALRLMRLGGRWWKIKDHYCHHNNQEIFSYGHHYPPDLDVGYPASGDIPPEKPQNWTRFTLCATMEERCEMLRGFGAEWYASVE